MEHRANSPIASALRCGYNDHMTRSAIVSARALKTRLGTYLGRVRRGETILVTGRNEAVAELRPLPGASDARLPCLQTAAAGVVPLPVRPAPGRFPPIRSRGKLGSAAVSSDRDDRGSCDSLTRERP
jgi:antitoxin (DNA-binding transcriptional repressor) of toxin-antitoxin stability system